MKLAADLIGILSTRFSDEGHTQFSSDYLLKEMNLAQLEVCSLMNPENLGCLTIKDEIIHFDIYGQFNLSGLSENKLDGDKFVKKVMLYKKNADTGTVKVRPFRILFENDINKLIMNDYFTGTETFPLCYLSGEQIEAFAELSIKTEPAGVEDHELVAASGEKVSSGGPLSPLDDTYEGCMLCNPVSKNIYHVNAYLADGLANPVFSGFIEGIRPEDMDVTDWVLLSHLDNRYLGTAAITYVKKPDRMTNAEGNECELSEQLINIMLLLAESSIWRTDGKYERANQVFVRAKNIIDTLNGTIPVSDNTGYRARKD